MVKRIACGIAYGALWFLIIDVLLASLIVAQHACTDDEVTFIETFHASSYVCGVVLLVFFASWCLINIIDRD